MVDDIGKEIDKLLFGVRRSIRYHNRRRQFFDRTHKFSTFLSALTGTATIASVLAKAGPAWTLSFAVAVAVFSVIDLVVGTAQAARLHNDLSKRFFNLEKSIISLKEPTKENLADFTAERLDIESDEPPPLKILDSICHNELLRAMGYKYGQSPYVEIKWYQRILSQFFDFREHTVH
jgi:hypothetical protein